MLLSEAECTTLTQMLLSGVRLDGRTLKEYREINFRFPSGHPCGGCCIVNIGSTSVFAKVSTEVVEPKHFRPAQGVVFVNFDATLLSTLEGKRKGRKGDDEGRRLSSVLQTCLRDCVDLDSLCIVAWERVFAIRVDLKALSCDGNLGDCGALAAVAALASFRRPDVFVNDSGKVVVDTEMKHRPPVRMSMRRIPVLVTLGLTSDTKVILQDLTQREEAIMTGGRVMVGLTAHGELCCIHTSGLTTPIRPESLSRCITAANARAKSLVTLVHRVLEGLERQRAVMTATAAARTSDVNRTNQLLLDVPLILSSTSFLPGGANAPERQVNIEDGELIEYENEEEGNEGTTSSHDMDVDIPVEPEREIKSVGRDPYGVIEVSSLLTQQEKPSNKTEESNMDFPLIESDATALARSLMPPRITRLKEKKRMLVVDEEEEEEEEKVTVQLF